MIRINDQHDQQQIDRLRVDLAQAIVDISAVQTRDSYSNHVKEQSIEGLRKVRDALDGLGLYHSASQRSKPNGGA